MPKPGTITLSPEQIEALHGAGGKFEEHIPPPPVNTLIKKIVAHIALKTFFGERAAATFRQRLLAYPSFTAINWHAWAWESARSWNE